jgi:uncharacterized membrane protein
MTILYPIHIVAIIVWLGGLFLLVAALGPTKDSHDASVAAREAVLSRYMPWGGASLLTIIATGIIIVRLRFGGFDGVPTLHRWNMLIGIPAIVVYGYAQLVAYRACHRAADRGDWPAVTTHLRRVRALAAAVLTLGLASSVVSAAARFVS